MSLDTPRRTALIGLSLVLLAVMLSARPGAVPAAGAVERGGTLTVATLPTAGLQTEQQSGAKDATALYVGSDSNGVLASRDGGATWTASSTGLTAVRSMNVSFIAVDPTTPSTIYVVVPDEGPRKTTDAGLTWRSIADELRPVAPNGAPQPLTVNYLVIDPHNPETLYVSVESGQGPYMSRDGGETWRTISQGLPSGARTSVSVDPAAPDTLSIYAGGRLHQTTDGGEAWVPIGSPVPQSCGSPRSVVTSADPRLLWVLSAGRLCVTDDDGASWRLVEAGYPYAEAIPARDDEYPIAAVEQVVVDQNDARTIYAGINVYLEKDTVRGAVMVSTDSGRTWALSAAGMVEGRLDDLIVDSQTPPRLYVTTRPICQGDTVYTAPAETGLFAAGISDAAWERLTWMRPEPIAIASSNPAVLVGSWAGRVFRSTDGGGSWRAILARPITPAVLHLGVDTGDANTVYAGTQVPYGIVPFGVGDGGDLALSRDGGRTWRTITPWRRLGPDDQISGGYESGQPRTADARRAVAAIVPAPSSPGTVYVGGNGATDSAHGTGAAAARIYVSHDSGETWSGADLPGGAEPVLSVTALAVHPTDPAILYAAASTTPRTERNAMGGSTGNIRDGLIFRSRDGGQIWQPVYHQRADPAAVYEIERSISITDLAIDPLTPTTIYAAVSDRLLASPDGGETWETIGGDLPASVASLVVAPVHPAVMFAGVAIQGHRFCTFSGGVYRSTDAGRTWVASDAGLPRAVCSIPGQGEVPQQRAIGVTRVIVDRRTPSTLFAVTGMLFTSTDGGETWTRVDLPGESSWVWTLAAR